MPKNNTYTYIQFPLFILRKTHQDFNKTLEYIIAFGVHQKAIEKGETQLNMRAGLEYLNLNREIDEDKLCEWVRMAQKVNNQYKSTRTYAGENYPMPNVKVQLLQELSREQPETKKIDQFLGYISVQSILGEKRYHKTNNKHVIARMMGFASFKEIEQIGLDNLKQSKPHLYELYHRYCNPKGEISKARMKTFFNKLMDNWRVLKGVENNRGYYIAMQDKMTVRELAKIIKQNKKNTKSKRIELELKEALKNA